VARVAENAGPAPELRDVVAKVGVSKVWESARNKIMDGDNVAAVNKGLQGRRK